MNKDITKAMYFLSSLAFEHLVGYEVKIITSEHSTCSMRKLNLLEDFDFPYSILVKIKYGNRSSRMIFNPEVLENFENNTDIIEEAFSDIVKKLKEKDE